MMCASVQGLVTPATKQAAGQACHPLCLSAQAQEQIHDGKLEYYSPNAILQLAALMQLL